MDDVEIEQVEAETPEPEEGAQTSAPDETEAEDELVISIGEEPPVIEEEPKAPLPAWVKELRKTAEKQRKEIRELRAKVEAPAEKKVELGPKPKLADFDYVEEEHEAALDAWYSRKREHDAAEAETKAKQEAEAQEWTAKREAYETAKTALNVRDFEEAEAQATEVLDITRQGIILEVAKRPELVIYALGKNPAKLAELASIKSLPQYSVAIAELEKDLKVSSRTSAPPPEKAISGKSGATVEKTLERLREEAMKTGDHSKVLAFKRQNRAG